MAAEINHSLLVATLCDIIHGVVRPGTCVLHPKVVCKEMTISRANAGHTYRQLVNIGLLNETSRGFVVSKSNKARMLRALFLAMYQEGSKDTYSCVHGDVFKRFAHQNQCN